jgi:hypothetical protein
MRQRPGWPLVSGGGGEGLARWVAALLAGAAGFTGALLVAALLGRLLAWISVDQPLDPHALLPWGLRWGGVLAVALASGAALGVRPPATARASVGVMARLAVLVVVLCVMAMGLAVVASRLGLWGQGWALSSRAAYAAQRVAPLTAEGLGLPAAALGGWVLWRTRLPGSWRPWRVLRANPCTGEWKGDRMTRVVVGAMILAVVLNGLPFWMRRVGLVDRQAYTRDVSLFCTAPLRPLWLPATCRPHRLAPGEDPSRPRRRVQRLQADRLHQITRGEAGLKGLRYGVMAALMAGSAGLALGRCRRRFPLSSRRSWLPVWPLLVSSLISIGISLSLDGGVATLQSAIWSLWIPLAPLAGWLTTPRRLAMLADGAAALVLIQVPFLLWEAARGVPLPFGGPSVPWLPTRLSGLMNQPNTLGGFLAVSVALCVCVAHRRWQRWPLLLLATASSFLARSGGGVVGLVLVAIGLVAGQVGRRGKRLLVLLVLLLLPLSLQLPTLLGRPTLLDSPGGRLRTVRIWLQSPHTLQEWLLGYGLASPRGGSSPILGPPAQKRGPSADDMPTTLISQGGLFAVVAFYGLVGWCLWRDPPWRLFWVVLLATSLTLTVSEVFPISLWMAVAAARVLQPLPGIRTDTQTEPSP